MRRVEMRMRKTRYTNIGVTGNTTLDERMATGINTAALIETGQRSIAIDDTKMEMDVPRDTGIGTVLESATETSRGKNMTIMIASITT